MAVVVLTASIAAADKPWEVGVDAQTRAKAQELFEAGNLLFAQQAHAPALEKYKEAIALWDHPLIRLNMAITELRLDRVLEAADHLDAALRYGAAPFQEQEYRNALAQQREVARRVGYVKASCTVPGAQLLLDGAPWLTCPARAKRRVLVGPHVLLLQKDDHASVGRRVIVAAGATIEEALELDAQPASSDRRHWPLWRNPWIWGGVAAVALGVGATFGVAANKDQDRLDRIVRDSSMHDFAEAEAVLERGERRAHFATGFYVGAGALAVAAITFALWPRERARGAPSTQVRLSLTPDVVGVAWPY